MGNTVWTTTMSLDGFIAGPDDAMDRVFYLVPLLLGDGVRLFGHPGAMPVELETLHVSTTGPVTSLRFRVKR